MSGSAPARRPPQLSPERAALLARWTQGRASGHGDGIGRRESGGPCALSSAQERLWVIEQLLGPGNSYNTIPQASRLTGPLDIGLLRRAMAEVVMRQASMRTRFVRVDGQPAQLVEPSMPVSLDVTDLRGYGDPASEALHRIRAERGHRFDIERGPLFVFGLFQVADDQYIFLSLMHHLISDGWSDDVFLAEVIASYTALASAAPVALPPLPIQYTDYAHWQRREMADGKLAEQLGYWRQQLAGCPPALDLQIARPRPPSQRFIARTYPVRIEPAALAELRDLSRSEGVTLFMTIMAAIQVLLMRYSDQTDILVGSPIAGRGRTETEHLIGCFINTLVFRGDLSGDPTFRALLARTGATALAAYAHQDLPFAVLVDDLQPDRDTGRNPLFQVMFTLQNSPPADLRVGEFVLSPIELDNGVAKFDITIDLRQFNDALIGRVQFDSDLFGPQACEQITAHLVHLLSAVAANADRPITDLPMMPDDELARILVDWNATERSYDFESLHQRVERHTAQRPDAVAVRGPDGQLSYGELGQRAGQLSAELRALGVGPDSMVALCVERSCYLPIGILGILEAGAGYVPLDVTLPVERLEFILADTAAPVVVTQSHLAGRLGKHSAHVTTIDALDGRGADLGVSATVDPASLAYVIYTSGSTGLPKGVMISHQAVTNMIESTLAETGIGPADAVLQFATSCFDVSVLEIFAALCGGGCLIIAGDETVLNPAALTTLMTAEQVTAADIPPAVLERLPEQEFDLLRTQFIGCEAFSGDLATRWQAPGRRLINGYGPTEATVMMTLMELNQPYDRMPPIGFPMPNHQAYVLDARMRPMPVGMVGELYIGGHGLARGYLDRPALTASKFLPDPFGDEPGARLYQTGDLTRYSPEGALDYAGRSDDQVKIRGYRIEIGEIEAMLAACPGVQQAVVLVHGAGAAKHLIAFATAEPGVRLDPDGLRGRLGELLPPYMVPQRVVPIAALPLTASGKVDRKALPAVVAEQGAEEPRRPAEPGSALERMLAGSVFSSVLEVEHVGPDDSFFGLGGNSLQLVELQARVRDELDVEVPLRVLFERPSVSQLAGYLGTSVPQTAAAPDRELTTTRPPAGGAGAGPAVMAGAGGYRHRGPGEQVPLTEQQRRLWRQFTEAGTLDNKPLCVRVTGPLEEDRLRLAVSALADRHDVLRMSFTGPADDPVQVIGAAAPPAVTLIDVPDRAAAEQAAIGEVSTGFDLGHGPLARVTACRIGPEDHVLAVTLHPLLWDGWSRAIVARELAAFYLDGHAGGTVELATGYTDYALWQKQWLDGGGDEASVRFWMDRLDPAWATPQLPGYRGPRQTSAGAQTIFVFPRDLADGLQGLSRSSGVTLFSTLLAAFGVVISAAGDQDEVPIGVPFANRLRPGVAGVIGQFVNPLPVPVRVGGDLPLAELLAATGAAVADVYDHQELPFEIVSRRLAADRAVPDLMGVTFNLIDGLPGADDAAGLRLEPLDLQTGRSDADIALTVERRGADLHAVMSCAIDVYPSADLQALAGAYLAVLRAAATGRAAEELKAAARGAIRR